MKTKEEYLQKQVETKRKIKEERNYIEWLNKFTKKIPEFTSDGWYFFPIKIGEKEKEQVKNIIYLFEVIDNYAFSEMIIPDYKKKEIHYAFKDGNNYYHISKSIGENPYVYCSRVAENQEDEFIDFQDVMMSEEKQANPIFHDLNKELVHLTKLGVPQKEITENIIKVLGVPQKEITENTIKVLRKYVNF